MTRKTMSLTLAALLAVAAGGAAWSGPEAPARAWPGARPAMRAGLLRLVEDLAELNITPGQRKEIVGVLRKHWPEARPLVERFRDGRRELRDIILATPYDEEAIRNAVHRHTAAEAELAVLRGRVSGEIRSILTVEQDTRLRAIRERVEARVDSILFEVDLFLGSGVS